MIADFGFDGERLYAPYLMDNKLIAYRLHTR